MQTTWDELGLFYDALWDEMKGKDPKHRAAIGALGVKVIAELRKQWAALCAGTEQPGGEGMDLTRDEMHTLVLALTHYKERARRATLDRLRELDALQDKIQGELDRTGGTE